MEDNNKIFDLDFLKRPLVNNFKTLVICFTLVFSISTFISFQLTEIFKSSSLVLIKDKYNLLNNDESSLVSGLSLISGNSTTSPTDLKTIEILKSRDFFKNLYSNEDFMLHAYAIDSYDKSSRKTLFKQELLDENNSYKMSERPPFMQAYTDYIETTIEVSKERDSGLVSIAAYSKSPASAKKILENVMTNFIDYMSSREKEMAEESYDFLMTMYEKTNSQFVTKTISKLIQTDLQKIALSSSKSGLIEIIDSPFEPVRKSEPSKLLFIIFWTFILNVIVYLYLIYINIRS